MSQPNTHNDTEDEFYDRCAREEKEAEFIEWCQENEEDPSNPDARDRYEEIQAETGDAFWDGLSPEDREGYEAMMTAD
jgi:hypothetical protein